MPNCRCKPASWRIWTGVYLSDGDVNKSISRGSANAAMALADQQRLFASRTTEAGKLANLKVEKAASTASGRPSRPI